MPRFRGPRSSWPGARLLRLPLQVLIAALLIGCSAGKPGGDGGDEQPLVKLAAGTCWSSEVLGSDEKAIAGLAEDAGVDPEAARTVMANRPAFTEPENCAADHPVEVYQVVEVPGLVSQLTSYGSLLRTDLPLYRRLSRVVQEACMRPVLARAAARSTLPGLLMTPALPDGMHVSWAPPSPDQFAAGQRVFACLFHQEPAGRIMYADVFTRAFPTGLRTCILSKRLLYVDCARKHDRERIAVLQARVAVKAGAFPGRKAIRKGPQGRYLAASATKYAALDRTCTTYLRSISTTKKLTGIAEIDLDFWPADDGSYPIVCEADTRPNQAPLITKGSVYNRR